MAPHVSVIAVVARDGGIGRDNSLLWRLPEDLRHFKRRTMGAPIIMGRRTWDSIGRALPGRRNVVITRDAAWSAGGAEAAPSLDAALGRLDGVERVFVIGGAQLYEQALPFADELVLTEVDAVVPADTFFPRWERADFDTEAGPWQESGSAAGGTGSGAGAPRYRFVTYRRRAAGAAQHP